jgi:hypothetical protein
LAVAELLEIVQTVWVRVQSSPDVVYGIRAWTIALPYARLGRFQA